MCMAKHGCALQYFLSSFQLLYTNVFDSPIRWPNLPWYFNAGSFIWSAQHCLQMDLALLQCCAINHLMHVAHIFLNKWSDPTSSLCGKLGYLRFSNHIYLGQENLRCLCLTRWLANQGWLHWGLGHPKSAANIIKPCSILVNCYLWERRYMTQWKFWKRRGRFTLWQREARSYFWVPKKEFKTLKHSAI